MNRLRSMLLALVASTALVLGLAAPASAGGSGDFYYQRYSSYVCGMRISVSNYDNSTGGQTYHFAFQSLDTGYSSAYWTFNGVRDFSGYLAGYKNYSNKSTDHTITGYAKAPSGGLCYATIPYTAWR